LFIRYQFTTGGWTGNCFASIERPKYGFTEKEKKSENSQAQAPQTHEGKPSQEAFAIQVLSSRLRHEYLEAGTLASVRGSKCRCIAGRVLNAGRSRNGAS
jgi:hypothetical protein